MKKIVLCFVFNVFLFSSCTPKLTADRLKYKIQENVEKDDVGVPKYLVRYPEFEEYPALNNAIQELVNYANATIAEVKEMDADEALSSSGFEDKFFVILNFDNLNVVNDFITVKFALSEYTEGAAHPLTLLYTINYNYETDKVLELEDILSKKSSNWLKQISEYCIEVLYKKSQDGRDFYSDLEWIKNGAGENAENFSAFQVEKDGVLVTFQQYQVGPYASGMPSIKVPFSIFKK